jgi:16S rRNA (cytosine1402-N4)-methyltransferase
MTKENNAAHVPVLLKEVVNELELKPGKKIIDATLGFGGHTKNFLEKGANVLGIEWDPKVFKLTKEHLKNCCPDAPYRLVNGNFKNISEIAKQNNFYPADGILFDLGVSRWHFKKAGRGFSFDDKKLDMRINPETKITAQEIINSYSLNDLNELFTKLVQEKLAEPIAEAVVNARRRKPIKSGKELAGLVSQVYQKHKEKKRLNPATKVFLALRIEVNQELKNLEQGLNNSIEILSEGGKTMIITFHSGEDRLVKFLGKKLAKEKVIKTDLVFPTRKEIESNYLARSAKLRIFKKIK